MAGERLAFRFLFFLGVLCVCRARESCPPLPDGSAGAEIFTSDLQQQERAEGEEAEEEGREESEFLCAAKWNRERMRGKVKFMLKDEEKKFVRFRTPVRAYFNPRLGLRQWTGHQTWVWVSDKFDYMLYYPQNFQTLSLGTTDIISANMDDDDIQISCSHCRDEKASCGIGYFELKSLIKNVSDSLDIDWGYLCVEADGGVSDIVTDYPPEQSLEMLNTRNFALPDILYQWRVLNLFFSKCPLLTLKCKEVPNYYCYDLDKNCVFKEVLSRYGIIVYLAIMLWLYAPILVYYLPSSRPTHSLRHINNMFPTTKSPVYFGRCIQKALCYYMSVNSCRAKWLIRVRRMLALLALSTLSFRLLLLPSYQAISLPALALFILASSLPQHLSVYITPEVPRCFPLFKAHYPPGVIKWDSSTSKRTSIEYQKLSYIMLERMYMVTDAKFWNYILENSFSYLFISYRQPAPVLLWVRRLLLGALVGLITLSCSIFIVLGYFFVPMPYFTKELFCAIQTGVYKHCSNVWNARGIRKATKIFRILVVFFLGAILCILLEYTILTLFSLCYLLTEVTIFTYIGASITADKVLHYFLLIVALETGVYTMIHAIHKEYSGILKDTIFLFENDNEFSYIRGKVAQNANLKLTLEKNATDGVHTRERLRGHTYEKLYHKEQFVSYMHTGIYFSIVESLQPIRRQVLLLVVKLLLMLFFIVVAMWVKNVFKNETNVSDIFSLAGNMAVYFIPTVLQFLSNRSQFGRKTEAQQKVEVASAIVHFIRLRSDEM